MCTYYSLILFIFLIKLPQGGVSGISTISFTPLSVWEPAYVQWAFNIPLFIAGVIFLGKHFGVKTLVGTVFFPLVVLFTKDLEPWTNDLLELHYLVELGLGLGIGIVFLGQGLNRRNRFSSANHP